MAQSSHPTLRLQPAMALSNIAYTNCKTRTIDLRPFNLPENATESEYQHIYRSIISSSPRSANSRDLESAIQSLTTGIAPPVAFPTETVYGLGADATNGAAVSGIFAAKGRPSDNPLIVHVGSKAHLERLTKSTLPRIYDQLVEEYWPGPLTVLVPVPERGSPFAANVHPGQKTIGFRVPSSKYARFLISACDRPIAAPSANSSGKPSPTTAKHVQDDMNGKINFILDGGNCDVGVESTVVDGLSDPPVILRPGGISRQDLIEFGRKTQSSWERVRIGYAEHTLEQGPKYQKNQNHEAHASNPDSSRTEKAPRAPGMKYKHYAPQGNLFLFKHVPSPEAVKTKLSSLLYETCMSTPAVNGHTLMEEPALDSHVARSTIDIGILTTSLWPDFASLGLNSTEIIKGQINGTRSSQHSLGTKKEIDAVNPIQVKSAVLSTHSSSVDVTVRVHTISLGRNATLVAQTLFAALRTCDDLHCKYIFAEAPRYVEGHEGRDWEVVMERLGKAATETISN